MSGPYGYYGRYPMGSYYYYASARDPANDAPRPRDPYSHPSTPRRPTNTTTPTPDRARSPYTISSGEASRIASRNQSRNPNPNDANAANNNDTNDADDDMTNLPTRGANESVRDIRRRVLRHYARLQEADDRLFLDRQNNQPRSTPEVHDGIQDDDVGRLRRRMSERDRDREEGVDRFSGGGGGDGAGPRGLGRGFGERGERMDGGGQRRGAEEMGGGRRFDPLDDRRRGGGGEREMTPDEFRADVVERIRTSRRREQEERFSGGGWYSCF